MSQTLERLIALVSEMSGIEKSQLSAGLAVDQDIEFYGDDVIEFIEALECEFGEQVWQWPWTKFASLSEGLSLLFPFVLIWQLLTWPFRGSFEYPNPLERLELSHIAAVIDNGQWCNR